jgi:hypothetical protein
MLNKAEVNKAEVNKALGVYSKFGVESNETVYHAPEVHNAMVEFINAEYNNMNNIQKWKKSHVTYLQRNQNFMRRMSS